MASVFGSNRVPVYFDGAGSVNIQFCTVVRDEPEYDINVLKDPLTGQKYTDVRGYRWIFEVRINLFKQTSPTPTVALNALYGQVGETNHKIKRFNDDSYVQIPGGGDAEFTLEEVRSAFLTQDRTKDICFARWVSNEYVDMSEHL